jgi:Tfp pilus assembly protein FimT
MFFNNKKIKLFTQKNHKFGFTVVETLMVISIIVILISISVSTFKNMSNSQVLDVSVLNVMSVLNGARSEAVSSKNATTSGVRILNDKVIAYQGFYGNLNQETSLSNLVKISTSTGIGTDVIFNNVTGLTSSSGTITIYFLSDPSKNVTIKINNTGTIEKN